MNVILQFPVAGGVLMGVKKFYLVAFVCLVLLVLVGLWPCFVINDGNKQRTNDLILDDELLTQSTLNGPIRGVRQKTLASSSDVDVFLAVSFSFSFNSSLKSYLH